MRAHQAGICAPAPLQLCGGWKEIPLLFVHSWVTRDMQKYLDLRLLSTSSFPRISVFIFI